MTKKRVNEVPDVAKEVGIWPLPARMYRKRDWVFWAGKASLGDYPEGRELEFSLAEAVTAARLRCGLSQKAVAKKLRTSQSVLSRLETGRTMPTLSLLRRIGRLFNLKLWVEFY